jgi:Stage II sporulation protein E (SpoIIE)
METNMRGLHGLFNTLERQRPDGHRLDGFIDDVFDALQAELGVRGALVYVERREGFELHKRLGEQAADPCELLSPDCPSLALLLRHRVYIYADGGEEKPPSADGILPEGPAAGAVAGRRPHRQAFFFQLSEGWNRERVDFVLNVVRAALGLQLLEDRVRLNYSQAAEVQASLLRESPPNMPGFEIAYRSIPAIGDASGHGLPSALLVRDVVTALRMGLEKQLRIEYVFGKLNRVIHRSNVSSQYICVFYGELESNGSLHYVNAGHQPPLLFRKDRVSELKAGGTVIGPLRGASFRRGFTHLDPGDVLVLFTDGIVERRSAEGEFFGEERLRQLVRANQRASAPELLQQLLDAAQSFGRSRHWEDDVTMIVIRRAGA